MKADPRELHTPLTEEDLDRVQELCDLIASCAVSAREAFFRGSQVLARHHVAEVRITLLALIPLVKRLSGAALKAAPAENREAA